MSRKPQRTTAVSFSPVQYRPDLTGQRIKPIDLGVLMEFIAGNTWFIGIAMLNNVDITGTAELGSLSRELIEARVDIIKGEINQALKTARRPGDVLRLLTDHTPWSFHVVAPKAVTLPITSVDALSGEKIAEKYILPSYWRELLPKPKAERPKATGKVQSIRSRPLSQLGLEAPPTWMLPTEFLRAHFAGRD